MSEAPNKGLFAKCRDEKCGHCWIVAYYPMELAKFAQIAMTARFCPKCGAANPVVAKQSNGVLLEPSA